MSRGTLTCVLCTALIVFLALVLIPELVMAKKPLPEPEPDPDPAIAYRVWTKERTTALMVMNADGSNQTTVMDFGSNVITRPDWTHPDWAHDGAKLVFQLYGRDVSGGPGIYVVNPDGSGLAKVSSHTDMVGNLAWSPKPVPGAGGGVHRIACAGLLSDGVSLKSCVYLIDPGGVKETVQLVIGTVSARHPTWSPDGTRLALAEVNGYGKYWILDLSGDGSHTFTSHQLTGAVAEYTLTDMSWSKTLDDKISFAANGDIYLLDLDTPTKATRLTSLKYGERLSSWSPDDAKIVFELHRNKGRGPAIAVMNPDGTGITTIQEGGMWPTWKR